MNIIEEIRQRLDRYPQANYEHDRNWIRFIPEAADGFCIELHIHKHGFIVAFDGWREYFPDHHKAMNCFAFGLSDQCRLKVISRGDKPYRWILESRYSDKWIEESETGIIAFAFWKSPTVKYKQNTLIKTRSV